MLAQACTLFPVPCSPTTLLPAWPSPCAEVLAPARLAGLAGLAGPAPQTALHQRLAPPAAALADASRLARYALRRCQVVCRLLHRLATLPEAIEMARAVGLTLGQVRG